MARIPAISGPGATPGTSVGAPNAICTLLHTIQRRLSSGQFLNIRRNNTRRISRGTDFSQHREIALCERYCPSGEIQKSKSKEYLNHSSQHARDDGPDNPECSEQEPYRDHQP